MTSSLNGKTVVVIGGSSGIGAAVAKAAAARGAQVVLAGRRLSSGRDNGLRSEPVDVTDPDSLQRLFENVGRFDHLVYTSGPSVRAKTLIENRFGRSPGQLQRETLGRVAGDPAGAAFPR
jgi:NAD(P)-dependent dehydrogenase (short-subunit alcohol dehydrogenase family)